MNSDTGLKHVYSHVAHACLIALEFADVASRLLDHVHHVDRLVQIKCDRKYCLY